MTYHFTSAALSELRYALLDYESKERGLGARFLSRGGRDDSARSAVYQDGMIVVMMDSGSEIRFHVRANPRLVRGTAAQLRNIVISPFGLHWPDLDEDLSFRGILLGDHGQHQKVEPGT